MDGKLGEKRGFVFYLGWIASVLAIFTFLSFIDQIRLNLAGHTGSMILPAVTVVNCTTWVAYALLKEKVDWPIFLCNFVGIVVGSATLLSGLLV